MSHFTHNDDAGVIRSVLSGSRDDFGRLVDRYLPMVHALVRANLGAWGDIDDIAQDAFLAAFNSLDKLREPEKFAGWLASITRHECARHVNEKNRFERNDVAWREASPTSTIDDPGQRELRSMLEQAVRDLDVQHREILLLYYFSKKDLGEIEGVLGITRENAKKRLQRARAALRLHITSQLDELLEEYAPNKNQTTRVLGAIALAHPAWIAATNTPFTSTALSGGTAVMNAKTVLAIGAAMFVLLGFTSYSVVKGRDASRTSIPALDSARESAIAISARAVSTSTSSRENGAVPAPVKKTVAPTIMKVATQTPSDVNKAERKAMSSNRTATIGGNAQRTGYYDAPAPLTKPTVRWELELDDLPGTMPAVDAQGRVFVSHGSRGKGDLLSAYSSLGELLWEYGTDNGSRSLQGPAFLPDGKLIFGFHDGGTRAFDPQTGTVGWSAPVGSGNPSPLADKNGDLYVEGSSSATALFKIDGDTGTIIWPKVVEELQVSWGHSPALSRDENTVYMSYHNDTVDALQAIAASNGDVLWRFTPPGSSDYLGTWETPSIGSNGTIYVHDAASGLLYAIADKGTEATQLWTYDPSSSGFVQRFEETNESAVMNETAYRAHDAPRLVATDGDAVYMGVFGYPASLHAVNTDGSPRWHTTLGEDVVAGSPVVTNDAVYILGGGDDNIDGTNALYCLDRTNGHILWQMNVTSPGGDVGESVAIAPDGTIYVATSGPNAVGTVLRALR